MITRLELSSLEFGKTCNIISVLFLAIGTLVSAVEFPNNITGEPTIECGTETISINLETFTGDAPSKIFAKGQSGKEGCYFTNTKSATFDLTSCGMERQRALTPRGLSYNLVVVVQMHPLFITKVDKAYFIKCFYMEASKTVTAGLDVSMLTTETIENQHAMPQCMYGLHADSPNGAMVRYARVGDKVWHVWNCPSDVYGMLIHSCFVEDATGTQQQVLDENGCGVDKVIMTTPIYSDDLTTAQQETHVFKFADQINVRFACQIKLCFRSGGGCQNITPPTCPDSVTTTTVEEETPEITLSLSEQTAPDSFIGGAATLGERLDNTPSTQNEITNEELIPLVGKTEPITSDFERTTETETETPTTETAQTTSSALDSADTDSTQYTVETVNSTSFDGDDIPAFTPAGIEILDSSLLLEDENGSGAGDGVTAASESVPLAFFDERYGSYGPETIARDDVAPLGSIRSPEKRRAILSGSREDPIRALANREELPKLEMDINQEMMVLDQSEKEPIPENLRTRHTPGLEILEQETIKSDSICLSSVGFALILCTFFIMVLVCGVAMVVLCARRGDAGQKRGVHPQHCGASVRSASSIAGSEEGLRPTLQDHYRYRMGLYK